MNPAAVSYVHENPESAPFAPSEPDGAGNAAEKMLNGIGQLTRKLHENLRELGYDRLIEDAAVSIPDARDRLNYVATMTEQAAQRVLNATDIAQPLQEKLGRDAEVLAKRWNALLEQKLPLDIFRDLVADTRAFLNDAPGYAQQTNAQLLEIVMAQGFQDLTGQVIKKTTDIIRSVEQQLIELLLESVPRERRVEALPGLINGPVVDQTRGDVVTSQTQVDDLLDSLGF